MLFNLVLPSLEHGLGQSSSVLQAIYAINEQKKQDECMTCLTAYIHGLYPLSIISGTEHNLMKTAHMTQHPLSIFDAAYMGIDKILPK